jgi:phenylpropionate dioxygenase-like ring-hydroxylating dioxygenase large terminal subunit
VARAGDLVFVNLQPEGPTLREHLGSFAEEFEKYYTGIRRIDVHQVETPVNWKVIAENAVESYHVPMVHPGTYEQYRPEELHDHRLEETYSRYGDLMSYSSERSLEALGFRLYTRLLIRNPNYRRFTHVHWYPNSLLYFGDIFRAFNVLEPLGPERTRLTFHSFAPRNIRGGWLGLVVQNLSLTYFLRVGKRIVNEDLSFWPPVQRGLKHSPFRGVLSRREERVYGIQRYIAQRLGLPVPAIPTKSNPS